MTAPAASSDPIKHVVVLMLENRSFDQMLGVFKADYPGLDGIDVGKPGSNDDPGGVTWFQQPITLTSIDPDPMHELENVLSQLENNNGGFVRDFVRFYPRKKRRLRRNIMGYYPRGFLPTLHHLAEQFTICDRWFSSVPGPTWCNRFFVHSGTSLGITTMPTSLPELIDHLGWFPHHVSPPAAEPPDDEQREYTFDRLGVRVPALLISPWVKQGFDSTVYDHTSVLKYLTEKWDLGPLGRRVAAANSFAHLIRTPDGRPRADTPVLIRRPGAKMLAGVMKTEARLKLTKHEKMMLGFSAYLVKELDGVPMPGDFKEPTTK